MSHAPEKSRPVSRPHSQKLDKPLDRAHQARQNAKAVPAKLSNKPIKPPR